MAEMGDRQHRAVRALVAWMLLLATFKFAPETWIQ